MTSECLFHTAGKVVGFAQDLEITRKENHEPEQLAGFFLLRLCARCEMVITSLELGDRLGEEKVQVESNGSVIFLNPCAEGCPKTELFINFEPGTHNLLGCNFCQNKITGQHLGAMITHWDRVQNEKRMKRNDRQG